MVMVVVLLVGYCGLVVVMVVLIVFVRVAFSGCCKRAIVKWMLCHGGIDIGGVVVGMVDIVGYFTNDEIVLVLITTTTIHSIH